MPIEQDFRQAIIENLDDARRLIFADWLEKNGDLDRAEFIGVQCELERGDLVVAYFGLGEAGQGGRR